MQEHNPVVLACIQKGECPICGKEKPAVLVNDARYGEVKVCKNHRVAIAAVGGCHGDLNVI